MLLAGLLYAPRRRNAGMPWRAERRVPSSLHDRCLHRPAEERLPKSASGTRDSPQTANSSSGQNGARTCADDAEPAESASQTDEYSLSIPRHTDYGESENLHDPRAHHPAGDPNATSPLVAPLGRRPRRRTLTSPTAMHPFPTLSRDSGDSVPDEWDVNIVQVEWFGVDGLVPLCPLPVSSVGWIQHSFQELLVPLGPSDIFRRTATGTIDERRVVDFGMPSSSLPDVDIVLPVVAEIVDVAELGGTVSNEGLDPNASRIPELPFGVTFGVGYAIRSPSVLEFEQMCVVPAERDLDDFVQFGQRCGEGDVDTAPDSRSDVPKFNTDASDGFRHCPLFRNAPCRGAIPFLHYDYPVPRHRSIGKMPEYESCRGALNAFASPPTASVASGRPSRIRSGHRTQQAAESVRRLSLA